jgi:hypothetical protein
MIRLLRKHRAEFAGLAYRLPIGIYQSADAARFTGSGHFVIRRRMAGTGQLPRTGTRTVPLLCRFTAT